MPAPTTPRDLYDRVRRRVLLHRRGLTALFAGLAIYVLITTAQKPPPETISVWTASRNLASGATLTRSDLAQREFLPGSLPAGPLPDETELTGHMLAAPVGSGEVLTTGRLVGRELGASYPGRRIVPVRLGDEAIAGLLQVGDEITLLAADPTDQDDAETLTDDAVVAGLPKVAATTSFESSGRLVLVAVPSEDALRVASAGPTRFLIALWGR
jgi:pilus assembly protein CpaB